jgi:hypothetical protein
MALTYNSNVLAQVLRASEVCHGVPRLVQHSKNTSRTSRKRECREDSIGLSKGKAMLLTLIQQHLLRRPRETPQWSEYTCKGIGLVTWGPRLLYDRDDRYQSGQGRVAPANQAEARRPCQSPHPPSRANKQPSPIHHPGQHPARCAQPTLYTYMPRTL